ERARLPGRAERCDGRYLAPRLRRARRAGWQYREAGRQRVIPLVPARRRRAARAHRRCVAGRSARARCAGGTHDRGRPAMDTQSCDGAIAMNLPDAQIAILAENLYQELELWYPLMRLREEGCNIVVVGPTEQTYASKLGYPVKPDIAIADADPAAFDAVVIPGGFAPENMRRHKAMIEFVRKVHDQGSLVAAVCHAGLVLASAGIARDRDLTCVALVKDDVIHAGGRYRDQ